MLGKKLDGYYDKPFRKDRNCFGGGVLVYVSTTLKVKRRVDLVIVLPYDH
jgi:hypothetical protein